METNLYQFSFCREDAERIVQALRIQANGLKYLAENSIADPYAEVCWDECGIVNAIADDIEFILPE